MPQHPVAPAATEPEAEQAEHGDDEAEQRDGEEGSDEMKNSGQATPAPSSTPCTPADASRRPVFGGHLRAGRSVRSTAETVVRPSTPPRT